MPDVFHTLVRPGGAAMANEIIRIRLLAAATGEGEGFIATQQKAVISESKVLTDSTGKWTVTLVANALIVPANTTYEVVQPGITGGRVTETFIVPNAAGPFWLGDILAPAPAGLPQYGLDVHDASLTAHAGELLPVTHNTDATAHAGTFMLLTDTAFNVKKPPAGFTAAVGNGVADDTAALQAAINACISSGDPTVAGRTALRALYLPIGTYKISAPLLIRSVRGFMMFGESQFTTQISPIGNVSTLLDLDGVAYSSFANFRFSGGGTCTNALFIHQSATTAIGSTRNTFRSISVDGGLQYVNGFAVGTDSTRAVDECSFHDCVAGGQWAGRSINDAATTSGSPTLTSATANFTSADTGRSIHGLRGVADGTTITFVNATTVTMSVNATLTLTGYSLIISNTTYWQNGWVMGSGATGNVLGNYLYRCNANFMYTGVKWFGSSGGVFGVGFQYNGIDLWGHTMNREVLVLGVRSEHSMRLWQGQDGPTNTGGTGGVGIVNLQNINFNGADLHADGYFIAHGHGGNLTLQGIVVTGVALDKTKIYCAIQGSSGLTVDVIGVSIPTVVTSLFVFVGGTITLNLHSYQQLNAIYEVAARNQLISSFSVADPGRPAKFGVLDTTSLLVGGSFEIKEDVSNVHLNRTGGTRSLNIGNFTTMNAPGVVLRTTTHDVSANITLADAKNIAVNATTGTKIGTAATQKLGFWNATPVVQPAANPDTSGATLAALETEVNELKALLRSIGLMAP